MALAEADLRPSRGSLQLVDAPLTKTRPGGVSALGARGVLREISNTRILLDRYIKGPVCLLTGRTLQRIFPDNKTTRRRPFVARSLASLGFKPQDHQSFLSNRGVNGEVAAFVAEVLDTPDVAQQNEWMLVALGPGLVYLADELMGRPHPTKEDLVKKYNK